MESYDVIFVDDEPTLVEIFTHMVQLRYSHWQTAAFFDAEAVYQQVIDRHLSARVWILDLMMPGKSGVEIARAIRSTAEPGTQLIGYTALDPATLSTTLEYRDALRYFDRVSSKNESMMNLLNAVNAALMAAPRR